MRLKTPTNPLQQIPKQVDCFSSRECFQGSLSSASGNKIWFKERYCTSWSCCSKQEIWVQRWWNVCWLAKKSVKSKGVVLSIIYDEIQTVHQSNELWKLPSLGRSFCICSLYRFRQERMWKHTFKEFCSGVKNLNRGYAELKCKSLSWFLDLEDLSKSPFSEVYLGFWARRIAWTEEYIWVGCFGITKTPNYFAREAWMREANLHGERWG